MDTEDDIAGGCCCCFKGLFTESEEKTTEVIYTNQVIQTPMPQQQQQLVLQQQVSQTGTGGPPIVVQTPVTVGGQPGQQLIVVAVGPDGLPPVQKQFVTDDPENEGTKLGRIQFSIQYDFKETTLTLKIIRAVNLVAKDFGGTSDPYVKVMLLPDKDMKLTTKIRKKNLNPRWNEVFAFEEFPYEKLLTTSVYMQVLDYDRFSKDDPIGELCIPMTEFDLTNGQTLWKNLHPSEGSTGKLGELMLSLCYDSANSTIRVTVVKAAHLRAKDINGYSDPYVKIWLVQDGKRVEKKRTTIKQKTLNPVFNETLTFQVSLDRMRATSLLVSVMDFDRYGFNEPIGQVMLGSKSAPNEVKHWNEMFSKARQEVSQWHLLRDFG